VEMSQKFISQEVDEKNVLNLYEASLTLADTKELVPEKPSAAFKYLCNRAQRVILQPAFETLPRIGLDQILYSDDTRANELTLFQRTLDWARAECKRQNKDPEKHLKAVLGRSLGYIRFPIMKVADIVQIVAPTDLLSKEEILQLCVYCGGDKSKPQAWPTKPRKAPNSDLLRFESRMQTQGLTGTLEFKIEDGKIAGSVNYSAHGVPIVPIDGTITDEEINYFERHNGRGYFNGDTQVKIPLKSKEIAATDVPVTHQFVGTVTTLPPNYQQWTDTITLTRTNFTLK